MRNNLKGNAGAVAALILVIVLIAAAFVVPWMLKLIDTTRTTATNGINPWHSGPGDRYGTIAIRFQLTKMVEVNQTRSGIWIWLNDDTLGREWRINGRITRDVEQTDAVAVVEFGQKTFKWTVGSGAHFFEYMAESSANALSPGWYKYVLEFRVDAPGTLELITWNFGTEDASSAGNVPRNCFRDDDLDGLWEEFPLRDPYPYLSLELFGDVLTEPPDQEEEEEDKPLIKTEETDQAAFDWVIYVIVGATIIVAMVALAVIIKLG